MGKKPPKRTAEPFLPARRTLPSLQKAVERCQGCDLYKCATHGVLGEGPRDAKIILIGEQPGDQEDKQGRPFVGPAGRMLDKALAEAGIPRDKVYITNAVKHFKWVPAGKRRLHQRPKTSEIKACRPWLDAEVKLLAPEAIVCMGAVAAEAVFGKKTPVLENRGKWMESPWSSRTLITVHPSSILRLPEPEDREAAFKAFVADLKIAAEVL